MVGLVVAVLFARDGGRHQHATRHDVGGHEALFEAEHTHVVAAAAAYLRTADASDWPLGGPLDAETSMHGVTQVVEWDALKGLAEEHTPEEIAAFSEAGAPLVGWTVAYFRPFHYADEKEAVRVTVDRRGRITATDRGLYRPTSTRNLPPEGWSDEVRERVAAAMQLDIGRLHPLPRAAIAGTRLASSDALWRVEGLELGVYSVVVGAFQHPAHVGFRAATVRLDEHDTGSEWGLAAWIAAALAVVMAVLLGVWTKTRGDAVAGSDALLYAGFGVGVAVLVVQIVMMVASERDLQLPALVVFAVVAAGLAGAGAFYATTVRTGPPTPPSTMVGIGLIVIVVVAFIASCVLCGGPFARGCCERCGILRCSVAPLAIAALVLARTKPRFGTDALILSVATLVPHCICDNFVNHYWIASVGASPMCFFLFYGAVLLALVGLRGVFSRVTLVVGTVAVVIALTIGTFHQQYHFPW